MPTQRRTRVERTPGPNSVATQATQAAKATPATAVADASEAPEAREAMEAREAREAMEALEGKVAEGVEGAAGAIQMRGRPRPLPSGRWGPRVARAAGALAAVLALWAGALGWGGAAVAQPVAPAADDLDAQVRRYHRHPDMGDVRLDPSGRRAALTLAIRGRVGLGVIDLDGQAPKLLAYFSDADVDSFHWVGDSHLVFDTLDQSSGSGDQRRQSGLFVVGLEGEPVRALVQPGWQFIQDGGAAQRRQALTPDHVLLAVPQDGSGEVVVGKLVWGRDWAVQAVQPMRLNVVTQRTRNLAEGMPPHAVQWLFDRMGEPRVAVEIDQGRRRVHQRLPGAGAWSLLSDQPAFRSGWRPHALDADGRLLVTVAEGPEGVRVLKRLDPATGQPAAEPLARTPGFDFSGHPVFAPGPAAATGGGQGTGSAAPAPAATVLLGLHLTTDADTSVWFHPRLQAWQAEVDRRLPGLVNRLSCRRCLDDDPVVLVHSWSDRDPGRWQVFWPQRSEGARWHTLGSARRDIDPARMATVDFHRVPTRDGARMPVWVTRPPTAKAAAGAGPRLPLVLWVHGGPWVRGGHWRWDADAQFLAARGHLVVAPEYRGSTGFGAQWFNAGRKQWGQRMQDDLADAVQWAVDHAGADPQRVCIAGASYGGYAALMGPVRHPGLYRCVVSWVGVTDLLLRYDQGFMSDLPDEGRYHVLPELLGNPDDPADAAMLREQSPVQHARRIDLPVLMAYGAQDRRVPLAHGERMREALEAVGRPPEWVVYPDEAHGWLKPENRFDFARRMARFLDRALTAP